MSTTTAAPPTQPNPTMLRLLRELDEVSAQFKIEVDCETAIEHAESCREHNLATIIRQIDRLTPREKGKEGGRAFSLSLGKDGGRLLVVEVYSDFLPIGTDLMGARPVIIRTALQLHCREATCEVAFTPVKRSSDEYRYVMNYRFLWN